MKKLYLMRHGETLFNSLKKIQGFCDSPLTKKGIEQAEKAHNILNELIEGDYSAYCSTSERSEDTLLLAMPNADHEYKRDKRLKEWNFGKFEGQDMFLNPKMPYEDFFKAYGGEDQDEFLDRINTAIKEIVGNDEKDNILISSHAGVCIVFNLAWKNYTNIPVEELLNIDNCCILEYEYDDGIFKLINMHHINA